MADPLLELDGGSSLPLFVWVAGAVLFAAFAFFAFAQAAVARNGAQSAADAAALAAAQEARAGLIEGLLVAAEDGDDWGDWLDGTLHGADAKGAAGELAAQNQAQVIQRDSDVGIRISRCLWRCTSWNRLENPSYPEPTECTRRLRRWPSSLRGATSILMYRLNEFHFSARTGNAGPGGGGPR
ncbi:pilus assembly protein TadG-related protein [Streptomyces albidoflavus]